MCPPFVPTPDSSIYKSLFTGHSLSNDGPANLYYSCHGDRLVTESSISAQHDSTIVQQRRRQPDKRSSVVLKENVVPPPTRTGMRRVVDRMGRSRTPGGPSRTPANSPTTPDSRGKNSNVDVTKQTLDRCKERRPIKFDRSETVSVLSTTVSLQTSGPGRLSGRPWAQSRCQGPTLPTLSSQPKKKRPTTNNDRFNSNNTQQYIRPGASTRPVKTRTVTVPALSSHAPPKPAPRESNRRQTGAYRSTVPTCIEDINQPSRTTATKCPSMEQALDDCQNEAYDSDDDELGELYLAGIASWVDDCNRALFPQETRTSESTLPVISEQ